MSEDDSKVVTLKVRVTPEFREKIVNTAKENSRSMNAEIVHRLEQSFIFDEADANGNIALSESSSEKLSANIINVISKIVENLVNAGVEPGVILRASEVTTSKNRNTPSKD